MCGIAGIIGSPNAAYEVCELLMSLQHRGQDASGILSYNHDLKRFHWHRDFGLVSEVFNEKNIKHLIGNQAIGHTRYKTVGSGGQEELQPMLQNYPLGFGMVHNGNTINYPKWRGKFYEQDLGHSLSESDLEMLMNLFTRELYKALRPGMTRNDLLSEDIIRNCIQRVWRGAHGGYSILTLLGGQGLLAFKDCKGIRPLVYGERELSIQEKDLLKRKNLPVLEKSYCFASEDCDFERLGYKKQGDLEEGEFIFVTEKGELIKGVIPTKNRRSCMFEWVYFASPRSSFFGQSAYEVRKLLGRSLAKQVRECSHISLDLVSSVPETGRPVAMELARELGLPFKETLQKNSYVSRSFILSSQADREKAVSMKLAPIREEVEGKNILLVDDSIVRGTTSRILVQILKKAKVKKIYLASACPPLRFPCFYGIDFPSSRELLAFGRDNEAIAKELGVEQVFYASISDLKTAIGSENLCMACLDGKYPVGNEYKEEFCHYVGRARSIF